MEMTPSQADKILNERIPLKISIIGVGNAGNQLLNEAITRTSNVKVFAINTSKKDLDDIITNSTIPSFVIGYEGKGAGKDRANGLRLFKQNGAELVTSIPAFTEVCEYADIIIVAGSTAGGTGSGVCPQLINLLKQMYDNKIIIYVGILPRSTDSPDPQKNALDCLKDIQQQNVPYLLVDLDYYKGVPNHTAYVDTQKYIMDMIDIMGGKGLNYSSYGMIDENDMRVILSEPGYLSMYNLTGVTQAMMENKTMQGLMVDLIKRSPAVERTRNGSIHQMGVILNVPPEMTDASMSSDYTELTNYIGMPNTIFENFANVESATGQMIIILSGQSAPINRVNQLEELARKKNKNVEYDLSKVGSDLPENERRSTIDLSGESKGKNEDERRAVALEFFKKK